MDELNIDNSGSTNLLSSKNDVFDVYLKKHKLDLKLLPNRKMIKLSDLTSLNNYTSNYNININNNSNNNNDDVSATSNSITTIIVDAATTSEASLPTSTNNACVDESTNNHSLIEAIEKSLLSSKEVENLNCDDEYEHDYDEEDEEYGSDEYDTDNETNEEDEEDDEDESNMENEASNEAIRGQVSENSTEKKVRRKREPSLKLKQKLSSEDLELIVSLVRNKQADVFIADVKKDNYVDKILKVKISKDNFSLSNGRMEALLKKSMFPKELTTLFDTFVNSLCGQDFLVDSNGLKKPALKCLVNDCDFKSLSEAEIMRHIKRHLAQDGYTCSVCSHQFASMTNLQRHLRIHTGTIGKEIKCQHCDYKAATLTHVKRHMAHKHLERSLPCPHCSFMGATNAELKIHMARKHLELTGKNPLFLPKYLRKDYQCSICKEQYNDFKEYQAHMYEHTSSSNRFQCHECPYNCKNFSKLKRHMLYHTGARNFECKICGNKFFQMEHLKRHMLSIHNLALPVASPAAATSPGEQSSNAETRKEESTTNIYNKQKKKSSLSNKRSISKVNSKSQLKGKKSFEEEDKQQQEQKYQSTIKIDLKPIYKCDKCEYTVDDYEFLNEHSFTHEQSNGNESFMQIQSENFEEQVPNENDRLISSSYSVNENRQLENKKTLYRCGFCSPSYVTANNDEYKCHFLNNHASKVTSPIYVSADTISIGTNIRYQCGACDEYASNFNEFANHVNEKHKIQVYLISSQPIIPQQPQTASTLTSIIDNNTELNESVPHSLFASDSNQTSSKQMTKLSASVQSGRPRAKMKLINGEHQQIRSFINSSHQISKQYNRNQNLQNTKVRINPLLLKRHTQIKQQQHQQSSHLLISQEVDLSQPLSVTNQEEQQIKQLAQQLANETKGTSSQLMQQKTEHFLVNNNSVSTNDISPSIYQHLAQDQEDKLLQLIS